MTPDDLTPAEKRTIILRRMAGQKDLPPPPAPPKTKAQKDREQYGQILGSRWFGILALIVGALLFRGIGAGCSNLMRTGNLSGWPPAGMRPAPTGEAVSTPHR